MKAQMIPLYAGHQVLDPVYLAAQKAGTIHRPNKDLITVLRTPDGKYKIYCIQCMRGNVPWRKTEHCGAKGEAYLCRMHRVKPDNTMATDWDGFELSLVGYEMTVVRSCRLSYLEQHEHWKCIHSDDPQVIIQGGGSIAHGLYFRRCNGVYITIEGGILNHVDCFRSGEPKYILQGRSNLWENLYYIQCSGSYMNSVGGILTI